MLMQSQFQIVVVPVLTKEVMVVLKEFNIVPWEPCLGSLVHDLSHQ